MIVLVVGESLPGARKLDCSTSESKFHHDFGRSLDARTTQLYLVFDGTTNWSEYFESFRYCSDQEICPGRGQSWAGCGALCQTW